MATNTNPDLPHPSGIKPTEAPDGGDTPYFKSPINGDSIKHYLRIKEVCLPNVKGVLEGYDYYGGNEDYDLYVNGEGKGITVVLDRKGLPFNVPVVK